MRQIVLILGLAGCGGGGIRPAEEPKVIDIWPTGFPVVFSDLDTFATINQQASSDSGYYCFAQTTNMAETAYGDTEIANGPYIVPCTWGPAFDLDGRVFLSAGNTLTIGALSGPWASLDLGAASGCAPTVRSDGSYVACPGTDLVALSPEGALLWRVPIGGAATLGLVTDDDDRVFALVEQAGPSWRLVAVDAAGGVAFDVAIGNPQDTPSLTRDGAVLLSVETADGPTIQAYDPDSGELLHEVHLDKPSFSVLVTADDDWVLVEKVVDAEGNVIAGDDTLVRMGPDGTIRWSLDGQVLSPAAIDDRGRIWLSVGAEVQVLSGEGRLLDAFGVWGSWSRSGPPVLRDGWFGATYDAYAKIVRLSQDVSLASEGWPRAGGSNRNNGRRPAP